MRRFHFKMETVLCRFPICWVVCDTATLFFYVNVLIFVYLFIYLFKLLIILSLSADMGAVVLPAVGQRGGFFLREG